MISICLPYYDRQTMLDRSLLSLSRFYGTLDYEIVICDDGSPDPVNAPDCRIVTLPRKFCALNPCVPINRAVNASIGDVIVLTSPEIRHRTPVLGAMLDGLGELDYVIASCIDPVRGWLAHSSISGGNGRGAMPPGSGFHFCAMFTRTLWERTGGFDERYRQGQAFEDNDWLFRVERAGGRFVLRDDLVVEHQVMPPCIWPVGGHGRNKEIFESTWGVTA